MGKSNRVWAQGGLSAIALCAAFVTLHAAPALAQDALPTAPDSGPIWQRSSLAGDAGGLRDLLTNHGVDLSVTDSENLLGNVAGGVKTGATLQGVTTATVEVNTATAFGWQGGTFHVSGMQIHGQSLSGAYLDNIQAANGNEAEDTTRLWELWYDQAWFHGNLDLKIGQQSIDNEFIGSANSALFVNTMAGWPAVPSYDLYGGGPAYPLASLGVRMQWKPAENQAILAGVFDDNPGGGAFDDDAQALDNHGAKFSTKTGALYIAEYQYSINEPVIGQMVSSDSPPSATGLPGTYKIGFWYDSGSFPDQRYGTDGLSLADASSNGNPLMHHGNYSIYAVADQTVWQSTAFVGRQVNLFARIMGAPDAQNYIDFFVNGGVVMMAPFAGRDNDQAGLDFGLAKVSSRTAGFDADSGLQRQNTEELIELTYQAQLLPWLDLQPDFQYIVKPGGGVPNPNNPGRSLHNEVVVGARAIVTLF